jgi:mycothiol synthase
MQVDISVEQELSPEKVLEVQQIIRAATLVDDLAPLSEHVLIHLQLASNSAKEHLLARNLAGKLVGYLHLDKSDEVSGPVVEVVVHPEFRNQKIGTELVQQAIERLQDTRLKLWAHGELSSAYAMAKKLGFSKVRELWQMRRSLYAELPKFEIPKDTLIDSFKVSQDEQAYLKLNAKVFAEHPEQGRLDEAGLAIRMGEGWFNPDGFLVARNSSAELTGFNWTKIHDVGHHALGEIYVLGVSPDKRGTGLGRALAIAGLDYLRSQGLSAAMLYVDQNNLSAIKLYESIGFAHWDTDVMFQI